MEEKRAFVKPSVGEFCCVPGCSNSRGKCNREGRKVSFYRFPRDEKRKSKWLALIRCDVVTIENGEQKQVPFTPKPSTRICSVHFDGGKKVDDPSHPGYIPTIFPRNTSKSRSTNAARKAGFSTPAPAPSNRKRKMVPVTPASVGRPKATRKLDFLNEDYPNAVWNTTDHDYIKTRLEPNSEADCDQSLPTLNNLEARCAELQGKLLRLENIKDNDSKFQFWTNLPNYSVFMALATYLRTRTVNGTLCNWRGESTSDSGNAASKGPPRKLSFEDELFLVLVKLKTGKFNEDLAHTFDISLGHVSNLFSTWMNFLSNELKILFEMQNPEDNDIAECNKPFQNLKVLLDCTELMVQQASNLDTRKKTFSNYKHYDTVKFLVGISSNLAVNYVSQPWGGRASDKHITLNSEQLMNGFAAGDRVMADHGFLVCNELKRKGVQLLIPEFKGRECAQFSAKESSKSQFISSARIHIEHIIQRIKTFSFLEKVIRLNMQDIVGQIFLERYIYFLENLSSSHEYICPLGMFEEDSNLGLRDIILRVIQLLKENKKVIVDDDNGERSKRMSFIKLIKKKVPGKTIATIIFSPNYGLEQVVWSREYSRVNTWYIDGTCLSHTDTSISNWFDSQDDKHLSYHVYDKPTESEGMSVVRVGQPLIAVAQYQFEVPALLFEWDGIFMGKSSDRKLHPSVTDICKQWSAVNPCGRIIVCRWGCKGEDIDAAKYKSSLITDPVAHLKYRIMSLDSENEIKGNLIDVFREICEGLTESCVYVCHIESPYLAGKFSRPPETAILAHLQKLHCLDLHSQKSCYLYQHTDHKAMAEKAGIRCLKISRILQNPALVLSSHTSSTPCIPEFLQYLVVKHSSQSERLPTATVPLYQYKDRYKDGHISVDTGYGYKDYLFSKSPEVLENYQEMYRKNAAKIGEESKLKSGSTSNVVEQGVGSRQGSSSHDTSRDIPKWMLNKSGSKSFNSSGSKEEEDDSNTNISTRTRHTEYIMTENELKEVAIEILKQAGRNDLLRRITTENSGNVRLDIKEKFKMAKIETEEEESDLGLDIPPVGSDSDSLLPVPKSEKLSDTVCKATARDSSPIRPSILDDFTVTSPARRPSPKKRPNRCTQSELSFEEDVLDNPNKTERLVTTTMDTSGACEETTANIQTHRQTNVTLNVKARAGTVHSKQHSSKSSTEILPDESKRRKKPDLSILDEIFS